MKKFIDTIKLEITDENSGSPFNVTYTSRPDYFRRVQDDHFPSRKLERYEGIQGKIVLENQIEEIKLLRQDIKRKR